MSDDDLSFLTAHTLRQLITSRQVSPVEVTRAMINRIQTSAPFNNVYLTLLADEAIRSAQEAEKKVMAGDIDQPLLGIPVAIGDSLRLKGHLTTLGSDYLPGELDPFDSIEVKRIRNAGGIILGKTVLPEFGLGDEVDNSHNPWDYSRTTGGNGTAPAVSSGLATIGVESDLWGSARMAASFCGVLGIKPTRGACPQLMRKHVPYSQKHFAVRGTVTHSIEDAAMALEVIADYAFDEEDLRSHEPQRIAVSRDFGFLPLQSQVEEQIDKTSQLLRELGHTVEDVELCLNNDMLVHFRNIIASDLFGPILSLVNRSDMRLSDKTKQWLGVGDEVTGVQYSLALSYAGWLRRTIDHVLEDYDLVLTPTEAIRPFQIGKKTHEIGGQELDPLVGTWATTLPFNMSGHPALTFPAGWSEPKLPIGMQLTGRYYDESRLLAVGQSLQEVTQWDSWRPEGF